MNQFNKKYKSILSFLGIFVLVMIQFSLAQNTSSNEINDKNNPIWVSMMDDPNVNYFEAIKAYEAYWKNHQKPKGEEEEMAMMAALTGEKMTKKQLRKKEKIEKEQKREIEESNSRKYSKKEQLVISERENIKYQVKRFENWMLDVKPFVQEDGRILTEQEKQAIWMKQQEELNNKK
jgi:hypothetical protein